MRVLVFGDSITQGYWDTEGGWVERIRKHYDSLQVTDLDGRDEPTVFNLGISADNSGNVLRRIAPEVIARTRHGNLPVVIIQIGINDSSSDTMPAAENVSLPLDSYEQNLRKIIENVKPLASKIILVGLSACDETRTTPVSWGDFHYKNTSIKTYENKMRDVALELNVPFIPIFERFREELSKGTDLLSDGLHPNNEGHAFMCKLILESLAPLLAK
jgi:lysophospholipase L1-like esterase